MLQAMTLDGFRVGPRTSVALFVAALLLASACSSDSSVSFDPVGGDLGTSGSGSTGSGNGSGAASRGGSYAGSAQAGSSNQNGKTGGASNSGGDAATAAGASGESSVAGRSGSAGMGGGAAGSGVGAGGSGSGGTAGGGGGIGGTGPGGMAGGGGAGGSMSCVPQPEVCDGSDNDCDNVADPPGTCPDGCTGALFGEHTYFFCGQVDSAAGAFNKCKGFGMAMASIESEAENTFVASNEQGMSWLSGSDQTQETHWRWTSSGALFWDDGPVDDTYTNWLSGQPNNNGDNGAPENCVGVLRLTPPQPGGKWNDLACSVQVLRAVCESIGP